MSCIYSGCTRIYNKSTIVVWVRCFIINRSRVIPYQRGHPYPIVDYVTIGPTIELTTDVRPIIKSISDL